MYKEVNHNLPLDMDGKQLELGHIIVVKYVWNSYAGFITLKGLYVGHRYHEIDGKGTYQIIGHTDVNHQDYNEATLTWINDYLDPEKNEGNCPVEIKVYNNK